MVPQNMKWDTTINGDVFHVEMTKIQRENGLISSHYSIVSDTGNFSFDIGDESEYNGCRFNDVYYEEFRKALESLVNKQSQAKA